MFLICFCKERLNTILIILNVFSVSIFKYYESMWEKKSSGGVSYWSLFAFMKVSRGCPHYSHRKKAGKNEQFWGLYYPGYTANATWKISFKTGSSISSVSPVNPAIQGFLPGWVFEIFYFNMTMILTSQSCIYTSLYDWYFTLFS